MKKLVIIFFPVFIVGACKNSPAKKDKPPLNTEISAPAKGSAAAAPAPDSKSDAASANASDTPFNITAPEGWTKSDTFLMGTHVTFVRSPEEGNDDFIENVNVVTERVGNYSLDEYFDKSIAGLNNGLTTFKEINESGKRVNGIDFKNIKYTHVYSGKPLEADAYFAIHGQTGYVITCTTTQGKLSKWQPVFDEIINSFSFN